MNITKTINQHTNNPNLSSLFKKEREKEKFLNQRSLSENLIPSEMFFYYGKFNKQLDPIIPKSEFLVNKNSSKIFNFVNKPFEQLKNELNFSKLRGILSEKNPILFLFEIKNLYVDVETQYEQYIETIINATVQRIKQFSQIYKGTNRIYKCLNKKENLLRFLEDEWFSGNLLEHMPLTFYSYCVKNIHSSLSSGLVFEIDDAEYNNEQHKLEMYWDNPDFSVFLNILNRFGFRVDESIPWRVYVDVNHPKISSSYQTIFSQPIDTIFETVYNSVKNNVGNNLLNDIMNRLNNTTDIKYFNKKTLKQFNTKIIQHELKLFDLNSIKC